MIPRSRLAARTLTATATLVATALLAAHGARAEETAVDRMTARLAAATELSFDEWKASGDINKTGLAGEGPAAPGYDDAAWQTLKIGESLPHDSCWLRKTIVLPKLYLGHALSGRARIKLTVDDAGTLWIDGVKKGDFAWDGEFELSKDVRPGQAFSLAILAINTGGPLRLLRAQVELDLDVEGAEAFRQDVRDLSLSFRVGQKLLSFDTYQTSARNRIDPGTDRSTIPREEKERLSKTLQDLALKVDVDALDRGDVPAFQKSVESARKGLLPIGEFARRFTLFLDANAHIDAAWLWRDRETVQVVHNTFASVIHMFDVRPNFTYTQSAAAYYDWVEKTDPPLFEKIKARAKEGRWEVVGGMWVEPDCNLPSGVSWSRHLLYAKRYFRSKLGQDVTIGWNPDSFGYNGNIPQLYKNAGIDSFVTQKIGWNEKTVFPYRLFWWEAPDGSRVLTYFPFDYVNELDDPFRLVDWMRQFEAGTGYREMLVLFGVGDHGGGPSLEMLARADRLSTLDVYPRIAYGTAGQYLAKLRAGDLSKLPVWKDEIYLEYHQGTYTTQARMKEQNREAELLLTEAERFSALAALYGRPYDGAALETAWRKVLFNQFHDLLPGSGIREIYLDAGVRYSESREIGRHELNGSLDKLAGEADTASMKGTPLVVFNPLAWERKDLVRAALPEGAGPWSVFDAAGKEIPSQIVTAGRYAREILFVAPSVPPLGYAVFDLRPQAPKPTSASPFSIEDDRIANARFDVKIDKATGWIAGVEDKAAHRSIFSGPANRLQILEDKPSDWDAWNIGLTGVEYPSTLRSIEVVERGPVRAVVRVTRDYLKPGTKKDFPTEDFPSSFFTQDIILYDGLDRIDFATDADWWEEHTMVKVAFPLAVKDDVATFEIPFGSIARSTRLDTEAEKAKVEVPAERWADLSQDDYGVSLLNRAKYGHDVKGQTIRLSLLRSPKWPDPTADRGKHHIEYALYPHAKRWRDAATVRRAAEYDAPLLAVTAGKHAGTLPAAKSFVSLAPERYQLDSIKKAEDSSAWIVQWHETKGEDGSATLTLPFTPKQVVRTDFLEQGGQPVSFQGAVVTVPTGKNSVVTLRVER